MGFCSKKNKKTPSRPGIKASTLMKSCFKIRKAKCTVLPQAGRKEPSPCRQTCWPTYIWAPAWKMRDKLLTRLLECFKGHMCCFLWRKNLSTCLWNWTSSVWPRITLCVNNQSSWERFSKQNWWIGAKRFVIPLTDQGPLLLFPSTMTFLKLCFPEPDDLSH